MATQRERVEDVRGTSNPIGSAVTEPLAAVFLLVILSFPVAIAALLLRYRRSGGRDRAQLRWVAFSGVLFPVAVYSASLVGLSFVDEDSAMANVLTSFAQVAFAAFPIGIGFAVLRQHLYDIDVVINRALVYGALYGDPYQDLSRWGPCAAIASRTLHPRLGDHRRRIHARHGRGGASGTSPHPRPPSTAGSSPPEVRRHPHPRALRLAAQGRGRPRRDQRRPADRCCGDHATGPCDAVAPAGRNIAMKTAPVPRRAAAAAWVWCAASLAVAVSSRRTGHREPGVVGRVQRPVGARRRTACRAVRGDRSWRPSRSSEPWWPRSSLATRSAGS